MWPSGSEISGVEESGGDPARVQKLTLRGDETSGCGEREGANATGDDWPALLVRPRLFTVGSTLCLQSKG